MAVRSNIGKLAGAIRAGQIAREAADIGVYRDITYDATQFTVGDWDFVDTQPDAFLMTLHRWGSERFKVVSGLK